MIVVFLLCVAAGMPAAGQILDVCATCHANATCENKLPVGSGKVCNCKYGFVGNGRTFCQDKDECQTGAQICGQHTKCHNTYGSFYCTCLSGYNPSNNLAIFIPNDGTHCKDIDECRITGLCGEGGWCRNLEGSFECSCHVGYQVDNGTEPFHPHRDKAFCKVVDCGQPASVEDAVLLSVTGTTYGSVATWVCDEGFIWGSGHNTSVCRDNGLWSGPTMVCEAKCGPVPFLANSEVVWHNRSVVIHHCVDGYHSWRGSNISVCGSSGEWQTATLRCIAKCGPVPLLANSEVVWHNRSVVIHRCVDGYHSWRGSNISVCGSSGEWQTATLRCIEIKPAINHVHFLNERCVHWKAEKYEEDSEAYKVTYTGTRDYQRSFRDKSKQFVSSKAEQLTLCLHLLPATNYSISIIALSARFTASITINTSLTVPPVPIVYYREFETPVPTLRLQRSANTLDPISLYQVFVVPVEDIMVFDCSSPGSPDLNKFSSEYITARILIRQVGTQINFTVGDGLYYGGFYNAPLEKGRTYYIILRVVSQWKTALKSSCVLWAKVRGTSYVLMVSSLAAAASVGLVAFAILGGYSCIWLFKKT
nr:PREDICTED: sushi domain-containing protein 1-like isoform X1 [Paralichthys olivaceus]